MHVNINRQTVMNRQIFPTNAALLKAQKKEPIAEGWILSGSAYETRTRVPGVRGRYPNR